MRKILKLMITLGLILNNSSTLVYGREPKGGSETQVQHDEEQVQDNENDDLHRAAENSKDIVDPLISQETNTNVQDSSDKSSLHIIVEENVKAKALSQLQKILCGSYEEWEFFQNEIQGQIEGIKKMFSSSEYRRELLRLMAFRCDQVFDRIATLFSKEERRIQLNELPFYNFELLKKFHDHGFAIFLNKEEIQFNSNVFKLANRTVAEFIFESDIEDDLQNIIEEDKLDDLQKLVRENKINENSTIITSFNEVRKMRVPLIQYCLMKKAEKCFKFLLINGKSNLGKPMQEVEEYEFINQYRYKWDCLATAIYLGEANVLKILEEFGIEKGTSPAHLEAAILSYRNFIVKEIISKLERLDKNQYRETIDRGLFASVKNNNIKGWEVLIKNGDNINIKDMFCHTLLHIAAENNTKEMGEVLISQGVDINLKDRFGKTPLHTAAENNSKEMGEILISHGADINAKGDYGHTPLHYAARKSSKEIVELLIRQGVDINAKDSYGEIPLHYAARKNNKDIVELLTRQGADINAKDSYGEIPLHYAARKNSKEIVELLISRGADINARGIKGKTPLHYALNFDSQDIVEVLIIQGANINIKDNNGRTPLYEALSCCNIKEILEVLISKGADINEKDNCGWTPLHFVMGWHKKDIVKLLISKGADINAKDNDGWTPLHYAVSGNNKKIIEILVSNGADVNVKNNKGEPPLQYVLRKNSKEIAELLISKGTDIKTKDG